MRYQLVFSMGLLSMCLASGAGAAVRDRQDLDAVRRLSPDVLHGAEVFAKCASCHGADGGGEASGSVPRIAGQHYPVLIRQLVDFRNGKRWDIRMEGVATSHDVIPELQDIADVARFVSQMPREGAPGVGDGQNVDAGARIYAERCATCHGAKAEGDESKAVPRLAGQHAAYLSRQLYDAVDGRRPALSASHGKRFDDLDFQQVRGIADWLSRSGQLPAGSREPAIEPGDKRAPN
jgi:cytochrome c553